MRQSIYVTNVPAIAWTAACWAYGAGTAMSRVPKHASPVCATSTLARAWRASRAVTGTIAIKHAPAVVGLNGVTI